MTTNATQMNATLDDLAPIRESVRALCAKAARPHQGEMQDGAELRLDRRPGGQP